MRALLGSDLAVFVHQALRGAAGSRPRILQQCSLSRHALGLTPYLVYKRSVDDNLIPCFAHSWKELRWCFVDVCSQTSIVKCPYQQAFSIHIILFNNMTTYFNCNKLLFGDIRWSRSNLRATRNGWRVSPSDWQRPCQSSASRSLSCYCFALAWILRSLPIPPADASRFPKSPSQPAFYPWLCLSRYHHRRPCHISLYSAACGWPPSSLRRCVSSPP